MDSLVAGSVDDPGARSGTSATQGFVPLVMAATAHAHGARLCTANPKDFVGVDELVEVVAV